MLEQRQGLWGWILFSPILDNHDLSYTTHNTLVMQWPLQMVVSTGWHLGQPSFSRDTVWLMSWQGGSWKAAGQGRCCSLVYKYITYCNLLFFFTSKNMAIINNKIQNDLQKIKTLNKIIKTVWLSYLPAGARGQMEDEAPRNKLKVKGNITLQTCTDIILQEAKWVSQSVNQ